MQGELRRMVIDGQTEMALLVPPYSVLLSRDAPRFARRRHASSGPVAVVVLPPPALSKEKLLAEHAFMPRWSPTERHIAFLRDDGIYTMHPDGSAQTRIFEDSMHSLDW